MLPKVIRRTILAPIVTVLATVLVSAGELNVPTTSSSQTTVQAAKHHKKTSTAKDNQKLAKLKYQGDQTIDVNNGTPTFTKKELTTTKGAWQSYGNLDRQNRPTVANAMLSKSLMPTEKREALTVDPTGWHNKRIKSGYLYNRSHLIGFQLTGQNNNPKNLITGTRSLNSPEMLRYEDDLAYYLKNNPNGYVRYQVTPIFRGDELVARGVHMQAQSIGSNAISFNVYIFNIEDGVKIHYADGTSKVTASAQAASSTQTQSRQSATTTSSSTTTTTTSNTTNTGDMNTGDVQGKIVGNANSHIYHVPGQAGYRMNASNAVYFNTEAQAQAAGYRKSLR